MWLFAREVNFYLSFTGVNLCSAATVTRCTCVFNDAISGTASVTSDGVIFKDIRCVCFFYPEHLTQTAEPTHAALSVGKR